MAQRRMMSLKVIDTDIFLDMPMTARLLYYDLSMRADDDGFVASPKKIQRMIGCSDDDLKILIAKQFIIPFDSGICVIRHWKVHNYIRPDRYTETIYKEERLELVENDGLYERNVIPFVIPNSNQIVYQRDTQVRLGKDRLDKDSVDTVEIKDFFESIWKLYPNKKGKGQVSDTQKKKLFKLGYEVIAKCIDRYETDKPEWQLYQNGSTFLNKGYADYLDANYQEPVEDRFTSGTMLKGGGCVL